jgi:hypothetical protein
MVTQFKDNPFQKQFYDVDKSEAEAEYKRVYYIPALESKLAYVVNRPFSWRHTNDEHVVDALNLLRGEIENELTYVGKENFPEVDKLAVGEFDSTVYKKTTRFLATLKQFYSMQRRRAAGEREKRIAELTSTPVKAARFEVLRQRYSNKAVADAVENIGTPDRIVEYNGSLVQKIYPIYVDDHKPKNKLDFSANLYQPTKQFAGLAFDTFYFNVAVIWSMTIFLFLTLYFDVLKRLMRRLERSRKYRVRDKQ